MSPLSRRHIILAALATIAPRPARADAARRIVSLGGAVTEILYRLGLDGEIVGVDATSQFPPAALETKPNVGYVRALGAEGILSLQPTITLATDGAGPPDSLRIVEQAGVRVIRVPEDPSTAGIVHRVAMIAAVMGTPERGAALIADIKSGFKALSLAKGRLASAPRTLFVLSLQNGRPLVGGRGTTADAMLALAGATNAASGLEGWKPLSDEGVIAAAPEAIVMIDHGPGGPAKDPFVFPAFAATPAAAQHRVIVMDGLYLLGFGPRTPAAALDLLAALHSPDGAIKP